MTKEEQFLKELAELTKKHGMSISGCCGGFSVYCLDKEDEVANRLYWNGEEYSDDL